MTIFQKITNLALIFISFMIIVKILTFIYTPYKFLFNQSIYFQTQSITFILITLSKKQTMFTSNFTNTTDDKQLLSFMGVDLTDQRCYKLQESQVYSNYAKNQLHYPIGAIQRGQKPHTKIGIKRLLRRNAAKKLKAQLNKKQIPHLNPKSPQDHCMKALRTTFRTKIEQNHVQAEKPIITKTPKIIKRKQLQSQRRSELLRLVRKYGDHLQVHFGARLLGFGGSKCPKVSRKQIKEYLLTLGIVAEINTPEDLKLEQERNKRFQQRGGRRGGSRRMRGPQQIGRQPQRIARQMQNLSMRSQLPVFNQQLMPLNIPMMGQPLLPPMPGYNMPPYYVPQYRQPIIDPNQQINVPNLNDPNQFPTLP